MNNVSIPWPVAQQHRRARHTAPNCLPDEMTPDRLQRLFTFGALDGSGLNPQRVLFTRWRIAPDLKNRVVVGPS